MKTIFSLLFLVFLAASGFAQEVPVAATDYVIEVSLKNDMKAEQVQLRYANLVSADGNLIVVKTSKDKSSFALKELENKYAGAKLEMFSGAEFLARQKKSATK